MTSGQLPSYGQLEADSRLSAPRLLCQSYGFRLQVALQKQYCSSHAQAHFRVPGHRRLCVSSQKSLTITSRWWYQPSIQLKVGGLNWRGLILIEMLTCM